MVALGFNYRIDEPRAALAMARLARLDDDNALRAKAAAQYREGLSSVAGVTATMPDASGAECAHHLFTVVLDPGHDRDGVRDRLAAQGIQTSLHYPPVHRFSAYAVEAEVPITEEYARPAITLPLFPTISEEQITLVAGGLAEATAASHA